MQKPAKQLVMLRRDARSFLLVVALAAATLVALFSVSVGHVLNSHASVIACCLVGHFCLMIMRDLRHQEYGIQKSVDRRLQHKLLLDKQACR